MAQVLWFLLPAATVITHLASVAAGADDADCPGKCGDVDIPYPWGIGGKCSWQGKYSITCNHSFDPPRPYVGYSEVLDISLEAGEMRILTPVSSQCHSPAGITTSVTYEHTVRQFLISTTRNEFTAIGCNTLAVLESNSYYTGCITSCVSLAAAAPDGDNCTGLGCCQTSIPGNLTNIKVTWDERYSNGKAYNYSPCSYAFVAEKHWYHFERDDLVRNNSFVRKYGNKNLTEVPLVLDWAIRVDGSCPPSNVKDGALEEPTASACLSTNSHCVNASQGFGYLCNCSKGYIGNPYVTGGCKNVNECELRKSDPTRYEKQYPCSSGSTCYDTPGDYKCKCNFGRRGDGKSDTGCQPIFPGYAIAVVATIVVSVLACFVIMELKKQKQKKYFDQNGGKILKSMGINIFTEEQLKKITNRYSTPIGEGAFGKVFMGTIDNSQRVAVKRASMKGEVLPQDEFVNEITFQFRINHTNMVRLLGCCLETDIPMLVFELVPKGSLYNVLHGMDDQHTLSLAERLRIAIGSAEALAHMHSHAGDHNHVHGDVKSGNILLDNDLTPKVSDFGSSKLVSIASMYSKWCVSGDMSYIDPVYIKSGRFTEKSDVYSFGVVLLELITRKTAKYGDNSLPLDFVKCCKEDGNGRKLYDRDVMKCDDAQSHCHMECLDRIGKLAVRCLKEDREERPTMAEVVEELKEVKSKACGDESTLMKKENC
ncbi:hypothetical protein SETIT_8G179500v2 [Setaria italica]|uniref:Protein kinase domain-containing protein n=1 Tax=Setaria italica TaxID=4555 RepID=A0A368S8Y8_SETIT|nr:wall-associated receptor kinase 2-like [Setaria italica]RCV38902.1 hypothetical protein SETIT_8G179500v2 [Setaria italica]